MIRARIEVIKKGGGGGRGKRRGIWKKEGKRNIEKKKISKTEKERVKIILR